MPIRSTLRPSRSRRRRAPRTRRARRATSARRPCTGRRRRGSCAGVRVPRDGGICARVVSGGAGEDFGAEVEENNLGAKAFNERWARWHTCSLCEQNITASWRVRSAGRAGRRTRAAGDRPGSANACDDVLGDGLSEFQTATRTRWSVREAELSMKRRTGASEQNARPCRAILRAHV